MKNIIQFAVLLLIATLFMVTACTKDKHMTDEHKDWNVLEWTVDGERYKAECEGDPLFGCDPVDCQYYHDTKTLSIRGDNLQGIFLHIYIYRHLSISDNIDLESNDFIRTIYYATEEECEEYNINKDNSYSFSVIDIDTLKKVIEGSFEFSAVNKCQDTVTVEDGYFKLTYRP